MMMEKGMMRRYENRIYLRFREIPKMLAALLQVPPFF
jgi:hypothetical protein